MSTAAVTPAPAQPKGFVSFIKKLGSMFVHGSAKAIQIIQKDAPALELAALAVGTAAGVGPAVLVGEATFNRIFGEVVEVEQIATAVKASDGTGVEKLAVAVPRVEQVILSDPLFKGKQIVDLDKWNKAVAAIAGAVYDLGNSVQAPGTTLQPAATTSAPSATVTGPDVGQTA